MSEHQLPLAKTGDFLQFVGEARDVEPMPTRGQKYDLGTLQGMSSSSVSVMVGMSVRPGTQRALEYACYGDIELPIKDKFTEDDAYMRLHEELGPDILDLGQYKSLYANESDKDNGIGTLLTLHPLGNTQSPAHFRLLSKPADADNPRPPAYYWYDLADKRYSDPDRVIASLGVCVARVANVLHEAVGARKRSRTIITLPGASWVPVAPSRELVRVWPAEKVIKPEHTGFKTFSEYVGLEKQISAIRDHIDIFDTPADMLAEFDQSHPGALLLHGAAGTGKTELSKTIARELGAKYIPLSTSSIGDMYVYEPVKKIRAAVESAKKHAGKVVLFIDEFDGLFAKNAGGNAGTAQSLVAEMKVILNNPEKHPNLLIVLAANIITDIDPNLVRDGRMTKVEFSLPNTVQRAHLFSTYIGSFASLYAEADFDMHGIGEAARPIAVELIDPYVLAEKTPGFSAASILDLLQKVQRKKMLVKKRTGKQPSPITSSEIVAAIDERNKQNDL